MVNYFPNSAHKYKTIADKQTFKKKKAKDF